MDIRRPFISGALLLLGGCVPADTRVPVAQLTSNVPPPPSTAPAAQITVPPPLLAADDPDPGVRQEPLTLDRPAWEQRPVIPNALLIAGRRYHSVAPGETGIAIARAYGVPWNRLVEANAMTEPFVIKVGQKLLLPDNTAPTLEARARAFRLNIDDIVTGGEPALPRRTAALPATVGPARFTGRFDWPVAGRIVTRFGMAGTGRFNQGIDIAAARGGAVRSAADGVVAFVGSGIPGYGGLILVRHGDGWISAYGYISRAGVKRGDTVKRGRIIGSVADDADPTVHFELRKNRKPVDPLLWLPRR